jgi:hypothetical protein
MDHCLLAPVLRCYRLGMAEVTGRGNERNAREPAVDRHRLRAGVRQPPAAGCAERRSGPPSRSASGSSELRGSTLSPCRLAVRRRGEDGGAVSRQYQLQVAELVPEVAVLERGLIGALEELDTSRGLEQLEM